MGARPVKNSVWYEINVAARLGTGEVEHGGTRMNLTDLYFDPNHRSFSSDLTQAGYPAEIDIIGLRPGEQYNISCKFTENETNTIKLNDETFYDVLLEMLSLIRLNALWGTKFRYILATNRMVHSSLQELNSLGEDTIAKLRDDVIAYKSSSCSSLNPEILTEKTFKTILSSLIILHITIQELEALEASSDQFRKAVHDQFRKLINIPRKGLQLFDFFNPDISLLCQDSSHIECVDLMQNGLHIHSGNPTRIMRAALQVSDPGKLIERIPSSIIGFRPDMDLSVPKRLSKETVSSAMTFALEQLGSREVLLMDTAFYILPSSFDFILCRDVPLLALKVKKTMDDEGRVYPAIVSEISDLGLDHESIKDLTEILFRRGMSTIVLRSRIVI